MQAAQLHIECPLDRVVNWKNLDEVAPTQLSGHCPDSLCIRKAFRKLHHAEQVVPGEPFTEFRGQLSGQCPDNLLAVFCPLFMKNISPQPCADMPVKQGQFRVDCHRHAFACLKNQRAKITEQRFCYGLGNKYRECFCCLVLRGSAPRHKVRKSFPKTRGQRSKVRMRIPPFLYSDNHKPDATDFAVFSKIIRC